MNKEKTKLKLGKLTDSELETLYHMVLNEKSERIQYLSNNTHTPNEQCRELESFFNQAWIHH